MTKQNAYIITDDIFMDSLHIICKNFKDIPYAIVGGGAVQVYVTYAAIKNGKFDSIKEINGLPFILRKTGDIDLSFHFDFTEIVKRFNLIITNAAGNYRFHSFTKRFVIQHKNDRFNLNYQTEPEDLKGIPSYYEDIIRTAILVDLPCKNEILKLKIAKPEYLIASKLTRSRPKDQIDISLILKSAEIDNYPFDSEEVRSILKSVGKGDNYDILMELMSG
ncbi:Uncharacterized protein dnl_14780 [Desulfonema limicola]|uniref:Uncharacterized protein n=1 Tax=Desulfonema limicola TaxID=45656 RepID=A0A975B5K6_9BACT|nr:nucleotidyl transferase AbiEii/AbiGii toxin family protein [Desulfonema limicola]QTA79223.1 Uncharacterized protein dnl_14780 [Desulfonema limicola]